MVGNDGKAGAGFGLVRGPGSKSGLLSAHEYAEAPVVDGQRTWRRARRLLLVMLLAIITTIAAFWQLGLPVRKFGTATLSTQEKNQSANATNERIHSASARICNYIDCSPYASPPKTILIWNSYFGIPNLGFGPSRGDNLFERLGCQPSTCLLTDQRALAPAETFDAVVYHQRGEPGLPKRRDPSQRYIFFLLESPAYTYNMKNVDGVFNWTMTYRLDSDIWYPYRRVVALPGTPPVAEGWLQPPETPAPPSDAIRLVVPQKQLGEPAFVAWLVSRCNSQGKRDNLVKHLKKYLLVDVYGACGSSQWPKNDTVGFYQMLSRRYKFYLSFENSLCKDYVTEKVFNVLGLVVPVVYGGANYSVFLPPHSYIDARAFSSARELAQYLLFLAQHPREYAKFLWWKSHYAVGRPISTLCKLCAMLHTNHTPSTYPNLRQWWGGCEPPTNLSLLLDTN